MVPEATIATARPTVASTSEARPDEPSLPTARPTMETTRCECPSTGVGGSSSSGRIYSQVSSAALVTSDPLIVRTSTRDTQVNISEAPYSQKVTSGEVLQETTSEGTRSEVITSTPSTLTPPKANFIDRNAWETGGCLLHLPVRAVPCDLSLATGAALVTLALVVIVQALVRRVRRLSRRRAGSMRAPVAVPLSAGPTNLLEMQFETQTSRTSTRLFALWERSSTIRRVFLGQSQATHKVSEL